MPLAPVSPGPEASSTPPDTTAPEAAGKAPSRLPTLPNGVAALLIVCLPIAYGYRWLSLDGDPGRHIRVGETILRSGLFYHDLFSFTRPGAAFVPYEWLAEILTAASVRLAGLPGLVVFAGVVLGLTYAVVARTLVRRGVSPALALITLVFVMVIGIVHWHARPHIFTMLCAAVLIELVDRATERTNTVSPRALALASWPMIPLFALWANLHGGFLYGLFVLGAVVVGDRLEMLAASGAARNLWQRRLITHAALLSVAVLATMLTPSGPGLYLHTLGYLRDTYLVDFTQEYQSPNFHLLSFTLLAIVVVTTVLAILPRRAPFPVLALVALNLAFALMSARNLPLFGIVALPLVAVELEHALTQWAPRWATRWNRPAPSRARLTPAWPLVAALAMFAVARQVNARAERQGDAALRSGGLLPTTFNTYLFPVRAVREARAAKVTGRLFSEFIWGGYILYAWPEQRVFIDGQTDFYGDSVTKEFAAIHSLEPGWRAKLSAWRIQLALLATPSSLADALAHEPGWRPAHCDSTAVLFVRDSSRRPVLDPLSSLSAKCASLPIVPLAQSPVVSPVVSPVRSGA